jgi:type II secretory pathway component PulK
MLVASRAQADLYARAARLGARRHPPDSTTSNAYDGLGEAWAQPMVGLPISARSSPRHHRAGQVQPQQSVDDNGQEKMDRTSSRGSRLGLSPDLADAVLG